MSKSFRREKRFDYESDYEDTTRLTKSQRKQEKQKRERRLHTREVNDQPDREPNADYED